MGRHNNTISQTVGGHNIYTLKYKLKHIQYSVALNQYIDMLPFQLPNVPQQAESYWCLASTEACSDACTCEECSSVTAESQPMVTYIIQFTVYQTL